MSNFLFELLLKKEYIDIGIIPMIDESMYKLLMSLTPEEQRVAKRKFRKEWRKLKRRGKMKYLASTDPGVIVAHKNEVRKDIATKVVKKYKAVLSKGS